MADREPLVMVDGGPQEIPSGDTLIVPYVKVGAANNAVIDPALLTGARTLKLPDLDGTLVASRSVCIVSFDSTESVTVGDGTIGFCVPASLNGLNLIAATASVSTAGTTSGTTDVQIRRLRGATAADMLSTKITLSVGEYSASDGVIDVANDDVATGDLIYIDRDALNGVAPKGLSVSMTFA